MFEFANVKYRNILSIQSLVIVGSGITTLKGPSGSGKSTLLKMLNKLYSPTEGSIFYNKADLAQLDSVEHRKKVVMLTQNAIMFPGTVCDNLLAGLKFHKKELPHEERLLELLDSLKMKIKLDQSANTLSGGEQQRVALARVLLLNPDVYLLDEPSSALDDDTAQLIIHMLADQIHKDQKSLIMVTHSNAIAEKYSDAVIEIIDGKCVKKEAML